MASLGTGFCNTFLNKSTRKEINMRRVRWTWRTDNCLTPYSRVLIEGIRRAQFTIVKKLSASCETRGFIFKTTCHLFLLWAKPHSTILLLYNQILYIIILLTLSFHLSRSDVFLSDFSEQHCVHNFPLSRACYISRKFLYPNNISLRTEIMKPLTMQISSSSNYFTSFWVQIFFSATYSRTRSVHVSSFMWESKFHEPYITSDKIIISCILIFEFLNIRGETEYSGLTVSKGPSI
jgi:hypothetical protein